MTAGAVLGRDGQGLGPPRAHPCAAGWPWSSVTVMHQLVNGLVAAAAAMARASGGIDGAEPGRLARPVGQAQQRGQRNGQVDPGRQASQARAGPRARRRAHAVTSPARAG